MSAKTYEAEVPASIALPSDPEDQSPDYDVTVEFEWTPGTPPSGFSGPPENYDPGSGDEFYILSPTEDADGARVEAIIEWLDENWERPDDEPDWDYLRDMWREDDLLAKWEASRGQS